MDRIPDRVAALVGSKPDEIGAATDPSRAEIFIRRRECHQMMETDYFHECIHNIFPRWTEEQVQAAEDGLYPFLTDNGLLR